MPSSSEAMNGPVMLDRDRLGYDDRDAGALHRDDDGDRGSHAHRDHRYSDDDAHLRTERRYREPDARSGSERREPGRFRLDPDRGAADRGRYARGPQVSD